MPLTLTRKTVGITPAFNSFDHTGANTDNEIASITFLVPITGRVLQLAAYFAGDGATVLARVAMWRAIDGNIAAMSPQFTAPAGSEAIAGQSLQTSSTVPGMVVGGNSDSVVVGFWRAPAGSAVWSIGTASGTWSFKTDLSGDIGNFAGNSACGGAFTCGHLQVSADMVGGDMVRASRGYPAFLKAKRAA